MVKSFSGMLSKVDEVDEGGIWEGGRGKEKVAALVDLWDAIPLLTEVSRTARQKYEWCAKRYRPRHFLSTPSSHRTHPPLYSLPSY